MSEMSMTLVERIDADLKRAMRERNEPAKLALRSLKTALMQARTSGEQAHDLNETEVIEVVRREAKRRKEAAEEFERLGAPDRAAAEMLEYQVLQQYLPQQLTEAEIEEIARAVIAELGADSLKQMGQVMPAVLAKTGARADGKTVNQVVRRLLAR
ncbi:MAG: GatB/YqeY domain-containing protein [Caldilinea sp.]|nr:GatB/YqeY domain-containing protein [Caldilinea sp.]MDW8440178.1 GatB/YqeY domain-containing protein [Caldilineaceae bacterium]